MTSAPGLSCVVVVVVTLLVVVTVDNRVYAKRGCSAFGHSCFGGHGKRFDARALKNALTERESFAPYNWIRDGLEIPRLADESIGKDEDLQEWQERPSSTENPRNAQQPDPYLSFLVNQWLATQRRLHQQDLTVNND